MGSKYEEISVEGIIRLGQFLKLAGLAEDGASARELIQNGDVMVDGAVESRRGKQLAAGNVVTVSYPGGVVGATVA